MSVPIESIDKNHLLSLIEDQAHESRVIDYKSELPDSNRSKKKFLGAVCAFANTGGGDLVYGMKEAGGVPQQLTGFKTSDIDGDILRLLNLIRDGITPRLSNVRTQQVELADGCYALVLRVPRSFSRPHVVVFDNDWRFYTRTTRSNEPMDVHQIRQAFGLSESVADRIRAFRAERLGRVVSEDTPAPLENTGKVVLHMVPISAFDTPASVVDLDIRRPPLNERLLLPISIIANTTDEDLDEVLYSNPTDFLPRYNFDGVVCDLQSLQPGAGYVQLFRTGVIEAADTGVFINGHIDLVKLGQGLNRAVHRFLQLLRRLGVEPPIFLMLSLMGVASYEFAHVPYSYLSMRRPVDRENLVIPEVMVESLEQDLTAVQRCMRPLLDSVWNAGGLRRSLDYDEKTGNWKPPAGEE